MPDRMAFAVGVAAKKVVLRLVASIGTQVAPLLAASEYCFQLIAGGT